MNNKKLILLFGVVLCASAIFGIYKLLFVLQQGGISGVATFDGVLFLLVDIIISAWAGIYLIKDREKIYQKLNVPAGPFFKKPLSGWLIFYALIVVAIIVATEFMK